MTRVPLTSQRSIDAWGSRFTAVVPELQLISPRPDGTWSSPPGERGVCYLDSGLWQADPSTGILPRLLELPSLRWLHTFTHGVDDPLFKAVATRGVHVTRSVGAQSPPIAQYVIGMMLRVAKRMDAWSAAQARREWAPHTGVELTDMTLGLVGLGDIGVEIARLAKAFRMRVIGTRRTPRKTRHVDEVIPLDRSEELFSRSDFVVIAAAFTPESRGMIGETQLRAMRSSAWLINVSRGYLVLGGGADPGAHGDLVCRRLSRRVRARAASRHQRAVDAAERDRHPA
ncbi:MAG: hypothetical protein JWP01_1960 [Myxococcales bacterium]|nr:hypothetical protein [Myxococcales bacterium]